MFLYRKNIILVPSDYDGVSTTKGLVSFDCYDGVADCTLRTYNFSSNKPLVFGVAVNGKLNKFEIRPNSVKTFDFKLPQTIKNNDDISCVLLDIEDDDYTIVLWGSTQINTAWKSTLKMMVDDERNFDAKSNQAPNQSVETENPTKTQCKKNEFDFFEAGKDESSTFFEKLKSEKDESDQTSQIQRSVSTEDDELDKYIEKMIELTDNEDEVVCEVNTSQDSKNEFKKQQDFDGGVVPNQSQSNNFYDRISSQINKMFEINQPEKVLNEIIPSSKFCRVEFDDGNGYYVFGIIYDEARPKYLCYGVPAQKGDKPPKEMNNLYQWLPVDINDLSGDGFYMMYQDAETGKNISVDVI